MSVPGQPSIILGFSFPSLPSPPLASPLLPLPPLPSPALPFPPLPCSALPCPSLPSPPPPLPSPALPFRCQPPWLSLLPVCAGPEEGIVTMALGSTIPASLYTLPRLWDQLKTEAQYANRLAQINDFNKSSVWLKRGISITPCRCLSACACCPPCHHCCLLTTSYRSPLHAHRCAFPEA